MEFRILQHEPYKFQVVQSRPINSIQWSTIGYGSKQQGIYVAHGSPLKPRHLPISSSQRSGQVPVEQPSRRVCRAYPKSEQSSLTDSGKLLEGWEKPFPDPVQAFRKLSELVPRTITSALPNFMCGSANLTGSDITKVNVDLKAPTTGLGCSLH
ncbi:hypothetical protein P692DRAFT_20878236 [Suillus brevipes Sb2]|nr:hypothetical protein P692DRAFT_20878236 [Suillus brevipes Sb2]